MSKHNKDRQKVLIVDDSKMNRDLLSEMLGDEYDIIEAENGAEAVAILRKEVVSISLVLLDIVMPVMDGYGVLAAMNSNHWIDDVPVIMISSDNSVSSMRRAYDMGVTEFISRPFDALIVRHRVVNTIMLYAKQKRLVSMVADQIYEKEKDSRLMIDVLSHIVEFRNGESGMHVLNVQMLTEVLLRQLVLITDKYNISEADISLIGKASALHDIGKISIPDHILNKPGRLTDEEFQIMKTHSLVGASMIDQLTYYKDEPLVKIAYKICRWHHERYDGRGYPDGLKGEDIPISAQIVALADVYDALTSERVYKRAFSHEKALEMILNGECGAFNPLLLECLQKSSDAILKNRKEKKADLYIVGREHIALDIAQYDDLSVSGKTADLLEYERMKNSFFSSLSDEMHFEYIASPAMLTLYPNNSGLLAEKTLINDPLNDDNIREFTSADDLAELLSRLRKTTPEEPVTEISCQAKLKGEYHNVRIVCRSVWNKESEYMGAVGKIVDCGVCTA
ncbi:MAG: response regulator [Ruminococcus sp.]|nr:response regulator [Ruminococcus sp.]MBP3380804.1 response regulator [Ruminococcus sp.]